MTFRNLTLQRSVPALRVLSQQPWSSQLLDGAVEAALLVNSSSYRNLDMLLHDLASLIESEVPCNVLLGLDRDRVGKPDEDPFASLIAWLESFPRFDDLLEVLRMAIRVPFVDFCFVNLEKYQRVFHGENILLLTDQGGISLVFKNSWEYDRLEWQAEKRSARLDVLWPWGDPRRRVQKISSNLQDAIQESNKQNSVLNSDFNSNFIERLSAASREGPQLRPHQAEAIENWFNNGHRGIYAMCTGAGKTVAALDTIRQLREELDGELRTVVVICPKQVLVEQWYEEIQSPNYDFPEPRLVYDSKRSYINELKFWLNGKRHQGFEIIVTTPDSFLEKAATEKAVQEATSSGAKALLIVDEMHNMASETRRNKLDAFGHFFPYRIGLTATPEIEGNEAATLHLDGFFDGVVGRYELADGIRDGYLCPYMYQPQPVILNKTENEEYLRILAELDEAKGQVRDRLERRRSRLLKSTNHCIPALATIIDRLIQNGEKIEKTLVFCPPGRNDPESGQRLINEAVELFQERSIRCYSIVADVRKERPEILEEFRQNQLKVLLSITCLDEGMNIPDTNRAIILYSHDREKQFVQRRGRVLREAPGKLMAVIHDMILIPQNCGLDDAKIERILEKETRRFSEFAKLAVNREEAQKIIEDAIKEAIGGFRESPERQ